MRLILWWILLDVVLILVWMFWVDLLERPYQRAKQFVLRVLGKKVHHG